MIHTLYMCINTYDTDDASYIIDIYVCVFDVCSYVFIWVCLLLGLCPLGPDVLLELPRPDRLGRRDLRTHSHQPPCIYIHIVASIYIHMHIAYV